MKSIIVLSAIIIGASSTFTMAADSKAVAPAPNGIKFPADYPDWRVISVSDRLDNKTLRVIVGNDIAIKAARAGKTNPWPVGAMLGKVVLKEKTHEHWPTAIVPENFVHVEFMTKDANKFKSTGGWGYARWVGEDLKVYGKNADFAQECFACHTPVKNNDYVFTQPILMPNKIK